MAQFVSVLSEEGVFLFVSSLVEQELGWKPRDLTGRNADEFAPAADLADIAGVIEDTGRPVGTLTYRMRRADGEYALVETRGRPCAADDGTAWIVCVTRVVAAPSAPGAEAKGMTARSLAGGPFADDPPAPWEPVANAGEAPGTRGDDGATSRAGPSCRRAP